MYDSKCFDLAVAFLGDHPELDTEINRDQLAQDIQQAIENFISEKSE